MIQHTNSFTEYAAEDDGGDLVEGRDIFMCEEVK